MSTTRPLLAPRVLVWVGVMLAALAGALLFALLAGCTYVTVDASEATVDLYLAPCAAAPACE